MVLGSSDFWWSIQFDHLRLLSGFLKRIRLWASSILRGPSRDSFKSVISLSILNQTEFHCIDTGRFLCTSCCFSCSASYSSSAKAWNFPSFFYLMLEMWGTGLQLGRMRSEDRYYIPVKARKNQSQPQRHASERSTNDGFERPNPSTKKKSVLWGRRSLRNQWSR